MDAVERSRRIAELAYRLWREEGFPEGRDFIHWLEAERRVDQMAGKPNGPINARRNGEPERGPSSPRDH